MACQHSQLYCLQRLNLHTTRMFCVLPAQCFLPCCSRAQVYIAYVWQGACVGLTWCILFRTGAVTKEMLSAVPLKLFVFIGAIEAASSVLGFIGAAQLPGALCYYAIILDCLWMSRVQGTHFRWGVVTVLAAMLHSSAPHVGIQLCCSRSVRGCSY